MRPAVLDSSVAANKTILMDGSVTGVGGMGELRAMVVDDEVIVLETERRILESQGISVVTFADPDEALAWFAEDPGAVDCAVLDAFMPGLGGPGLFGELRGRSPSLPVVILSGYSGDEEIARILEEPRTFFVQKPFERVAFLSIVRKAVAG
jgi:DNA-binding NtrC family response regulator